MPENEVVEPAQDETAETQTESAPAEKDWKAEFEKLQQNSRKWESRAKENAAAAARLQEIEDANKSEAEKLQARAEAAEKRANELEMRTLRAEVATAKGLTAAQAKRLTGSTLEELEADADDLLAAFPKPSSVVGSPDAGPRGGAPDYSKMSISELQKQTRR